MSYNPDLAAIAPPQTERFARYLSQRELGLVVPVNFVTYPGVVLSAACFGHGRYEHTAAAKCLSNLLATGFRRIDADVYWDASQASWGLCPFEIADTSQVLSSSTSVPTTLPQTASSLKTDFITDGVTQKTSAGVVMFDYMLRRQTATFSADALATPVSSTLSTSTATVPSSPSAFATTGTPGGSAISDSSLVQAGPYTCSKDIDLPLLFDVLSGFMQATDFTINATTIMLTLHLHIAGSASDPTASEIQSAVAALPTDTTPLSLDVVANASVYVYTPSELLAQRSNLNESNSWFTLAKSLQPDPAFFEINEIKNGYATPDGWPSESYIDLERGERILVAFGTIDPQVSNYNLTADDAVIFPPDYLTVPRTAVFDSQGRLTSGCFFDPHTTSVNTVNSSWATTVIGNETSPSDDTFQFVLAQASNLTYCGISPILNGVLNNVTADQDPRPYTAFYQETIWSWAAGQPINASASDDTSDYKCAAMDSSSGRWQASDCGQSHRGACRVGNGPYTWQISDNDAEYVNIGRTCNGGTAFDVPRNSLENTYLLSVWRAWQRNHGGDTSGSLLWLNFNDLDVSTCWVIGQNSTCPYEGPQKSHTREIVVPVVGAIIVFGLAALTVLVQCSQNRKQTKRRRKRGDDGWDYEGVPS